MPLPTNTAAVVKAPVVPNQDCYYNLVSFTGAQLERIYALIGALGETPSQFVRRAALERCSRLESGTTPDPLPVE